MPDTAIDGDISDYIDAPDLVSEYFSADLRTYLLNEGMAPTTSIPRLLAGASIYSSRSMPSGLDLSSR